MLMPRQLYSFGFLDEYAKKEIRRAILKAMAIPGYQVPYASREMPMGRGFGTGGLQLTLSLIGPDDTLKVIDQGSDESVNAVNLRQFICLTCPGIETTMETEEATVIQSRHRIPEVPLNEEQILVLQVPYPCPLYELVPAEEKRKMIHAQADYAILWVKLYEDLVHFDEVTLSHRYPTKIHGRYVLDPSPIPRFDVPKLHQSEAPILFGAGREKKIYAVPPYTSAEPLSFEDRPFRIEKFNDENGNRRECRRCGSGDSFLDEFITDAGQKVFQCSDLAYCNATFDNRKHSEKVVS
jgi:alpha-D-ribose 1-methylphosphonate 5-phosphate C-P lyase